MKERAEKKKVETDVSIPVEYVNDENEEERLADIRSSSWLSICFKAFIKPDPQFYAEIIKFRPFSTFPVYTFLFVSGLLIIISDSIYKVIINALDKTPLPILDAIILFTFSPMFGSFVFIIVYIMLIAMVQFTAKLLGGAGSFNLSFNALAIVTVPYMILYSGITIFVAFPPIRIFSLIAGILIGLYYMALSIVMLKAANRYSWWKAIGSIIIPSFVLTIIWVCVLITSEFTLRFLESLGVSP
jgi:hypothetical protein